MALLSFLVSKPSLKTSFLPLTSHLIPIIPSSPLSSHCTTSTFPLPSQSPPVPKKRPFNVSAHTKTWQDPYHWMRNAKDPEFVDYLNQENSYAQAFMADTQNLQRTLLEEMKNRLPTQISTPPERWGHWLYYQYIPEGREYPVLCRRLETEESGLLKTLLNYAKGHFGMEQVLLDWNQIAEQYGYVHVGTCRVSPDHKFLAYTLDITGNEQFLLQVKDLSNGYIVSRSQVDGVVSLAWAQDSTTLFYTVSDENQRPYRVLFTKLGSDEIDDVPVFTESNSSFCVDITSTKDGKFITVNSNSRTSSEVYVIDATNPLDGLQRVRECVSGVRYFLEHHYGVFYILTNAPLSESEDRSDGNYYLAQCQVEDIQSSDWQNIILPSEDMSFQDMDIFNGHLVLFVNKKNFPALCSINLPIKFNSVNQLEIENLDPWFFPLPSSQCNIVPGSNHDFMNPVYRVVLSSPVMPGVVVDYNMSERIFSIVQQEKVRDISGDCGSCSLAYELDTSEYLDPLNDKDKNNLNIELQRWKDFSGAYCCKTKEVISHDGVRVPLTILYSRKAWRRGQSPGLLEGYGAYGEVLDKSWCSDRLSLLDRGWVLAFADARGGGGHSSWHKYGSGLNKCNSIYDFISCGNYLVSEGYVHRDRLGAIGFSAGGLLVGAAININPNLFRAAILKVPFLDACNTLLDPSLPLTLLDYEEFGNPQIQSQFESILSYSPYDNIPRDACLPSMLVTASFHDSRVGVWEAAKWVAKTRDIACSHCSRSVILKTNMTGGHFGEGGCYSQCEETAYDYAFLMKTIGNVNGNK
ncbi:PREDICTED: prolyl endopeptidase-like [Populus euphratica]|uniref:Prolyl endopeptidase n=1 Tax=Populus euphratica TaxID=75702 RepID=A0AAJ6X8B0_POPEU|nr:PREDICTED: prolyl endopeptidase-like [Populus euphratica]